VSNSGTPIVQVSDEATDKRIAEEYAKAAKKRRESRESRERIPTQVHRAAEDKDAAHHRDEKKPSTTDATNAAENAKSITKEPMPTITPAKEAATKDATESSKKRPREEDGSHEIGNAAKKVNTTTDS
jgi:hypothetical protein